MGKTCGLLKFFGPRAVIPFPGGSDQNSGLAILRRQITLRADEHFG
jgi:hypothetical protein